MTPVFIELTLTGGFMADKRFLVQPQDIISYQAVTYDSRYQPGSLMTVRGIEEAVYVFEPVDEIAQMIDEARRRRRKLEQGTTFFGLRRMGGESIIATERAKIIEKWELLEGANRLERQERNHEGDARPYTYADITRAIYVATVISRRPEQHPNPYYGKPIYDILKAIRAEEDEKAARRGEDAALPTVRLVETE